MRAAGCSRRTANFYRKARRKPRRKRLNLLTQLATRFAREELGSSGQTLIPEDNLQVIRQYMKLAPKSKE
jgi:hypothetical protein